MYQIIYIITASLSLLLTAIHLFMMIRAVMSFLPVNEDSTFLRFVLFVTEPVILPVRLLLERFGLFEGFPVDMSFFITFVLLSLLRIFL